MREDWEILGHPHQKDWLERGTGNILHPFRVGSNSTLSLIPTMYIDVSLPPCFVYTKKK